jgi:transcriptional regulator with XRE-family HTH domain
MAEKCGVGRQAQVRYEAGERSPDGNYLAAIAKAGADVNYILTGVRVTAIEPIDRTVQITVELFNGMNKKQREMALSLLSDKEQAEVAAKNRNVS